MNNKEKKLIDSLIKYKSVLLALSGGVDSTLLLYIASRIKELDIIAVTAKSPLHMSSEVNFAKKYAEQLGVKHYEIDVPLLEYNDVVNNTSLRCYYCKKRIFTYIKNYSDKFSDFTIIDGTNNDDFNDYRPGLKACDELGIKHPLVEADMDKADIYTLSRKYSLPTAHKPSFACLASRIPYETKLTNENLKQVEEGETYLESKGFTQYRLRHHGDIARVEIDERDFVKLLDKQLRAEITKRLKEIGFKYITLDLTGYKQGSMNISL